MLSPAWSPDGRELALTKDGRLFLLKANGGNLRALWTPPRDSYSYFYRPSFSTDGRSIVSDGDGPTGSGIHVTDADGRRMRQLSRSAHEFCLDAGGVWLDGAGAIFSGCRRGFDRGAGIYTVASSGTKLARLSNFD